MKTAERQKAIRLRKEGRSLKRIAEALGVSKSSVSLWVRNVELTPEQKAVLNFRPSCNKAASLALSKKYRSIRLSFQEQGRTMAKELDTNFAMGCMLFWAEGAKSRTRMNFCNTDTEMMKFFISFLRKYFNVKNESISMKVLCHTNNRLSLNQIQDYWLKALSLPPESLRSATIRQGHGAKKNKHPYGICTIRVYDVGIVQKLWGAIQEFIGFSRDEIDGSVAQPSRAAGR